MICMQILIFMHTTLIKVYFKEQLRQKVRFTNRFWYFNRTSCAHYLPPPTSSRRAVKCKIKRGLGVLKCELGEIKEENCVSEIGLPVF